MLTYRVLNPLAAMTFMVFMALSAFGSTNSGKLTKVENNLVCMVNDTFFGRPQIPVEVGDKTYYGCCDHCKKTLSENAKARVAIDPVSKKEVDKAKAVIGANPQGDVIYFENQENFEQYNKQITALSPS